MSVDPSVLALGERADDLVSPRDYLTYVLLQAYFHALRNDLDRDEKAAGVSDRLSFVCEEALSAGMPDVFEIAVNRWKLHLLRLFGQEVPAEHARAIGALEARFGRPVDFSPRARFPALDAWTPGGPRLTFHPDGSVRDGTGAEVAPPVAARREASSKKPWWRIW